MKESFQNKLRDFAPEPPKGAWEGIASRLDDSPLFADRLAAFEAAPPASVWSKIEKQLDQKERAPLIRIVPFRRYAAAAILLVMAGFAYLSFFQNKTAQVITTTQATTPFVSTQTNPPASKQTPDDINSTPVAKSRGVQQNDVAGSAQTILSRLANEPETSIPTPAFSYADEGMEQKPFMPSYAVARQRVKISPAAERYMVYSDAQGNAMRVPRHMFDYVACITNELDCKKRIEALRTRAASLTLNTDFTGVLELLSQLEDGKQQD